MQGGHKPSHASCLGQTKGARMAVTQVLTVHQARAYHQNVHILMSRPWVLGVAVDHDTRGLGQTAL